jgi:hypothetical protein
MMQNGCLSTFILFVELISSKVKDVFKQQQATRIDENGNFTIISSLHRSIVGNRVEAMRKLQTKVNQACISTMDRHTIGNGIFSSSS